VLALLRLYFAEQEALGINEARDASSGLLLPPDIERAQLREELQFAIGQVIVNPVGQTAPVRTLLVLVGEPANRRFFGLRNTPASSESGVSQEIIADDRPNIQRDLGFFFVFQVFQVVGDFDCSRFLLVLVVINGLTSIPAKLLVRFHRGDIGQVAFAQVWLDSLLEPAHAVCVRVDEIEHLFFRSLVVAGEPRIATGGQTNCKEREGRSGLKKLGFAGFHD
jgi:hypothetical protein